MSTREYRARHRMPDEGTVRSLSTGQEWHAHDNGYWHNGEPNAPALSTNKLSAEHGPVVIIRG